MRAPAAGSQRTLVRAVTAVMAFAMSVVLSGCGTRTSGPTPLPPATVAPGAVVMVIRHGEKPDSANPGVDANGKPDDSSLTAIGWTRAHRLVDIFDPEEGPARPGLATPCATSARILPLDRSTSSSSLATNSSITLGRRAARPGTNVPASRWATQFATVFGEHPASSAASR